MIEHLYNIDHFLSEVFRILKPGGIFYLSTPNFRYCYKSFYDDPTHVKPYTDESIGKTLTIFGFESVTFVALLAVGDFFGYFGFDF